MFFKSRTTRLCKRIFSTPVRLTTRNFWTQTPLFNLSGTPINQITVGVPKEITKNERRVALTPEAVVKLSKEGFRVIIEKGAGLGSNFLDSDYEAAGA